MPQSKTQRSPAAKKQAATRKPAATRGKRDVKGAAKRTTELSDDVIKELEEGAESALEAVRNFLDTVDKALPKRGDGPSRREEITDSALAMAQRLVHTQADFLRKVVDSAGKSVR